MAFLSLAAPLTAAAQSGIQFDGSNDYVTFGSAAPLGVTTFTVELWFQRTGAGVATSTGTGGVTATPLLTKGRAEADGSVVDMNWFLGIRGTDSVLVADYEEGTGQTSPGLNHPIAGVTPLQRNLWYHAAATFDGTTLRLYLNGALENTVAVGAGRLPQSASTQHAALASALTSSGAAAGFFAGVLDEARVWNVARTQGQIQGSMPLALTSGTGLIGRWGLDEGTGTNAANSIVGSPAGTLTNGPTWTAGSPFSANYALDFGGTNAYVTFGTPAALTLPQFTLECWFRRDGAGVGTNTGTGGAVSIPLIAHGRSETNVNTNYFLGLRESDGVLMADFEEGAGGASPGQNHPVFGTTPVVAGSGWHHAAATYDGTTWNLYLDGALQSTASPGVAAALEGTQPLAIGSALTSAGVAAGFFDGVIDEARIWNGARSLSQIQATINSQLASPQSGLVARWGLDEGAGTTVTSTAGTTLNGTVTGSAWAWTNGSPLNWTPPTPPAAPSGLSASGITSSSIHLAWTDQSNNETSFEIERSTTGAGGPFAPRGSTAANVTVFDDTGLNANTEYCYRVRAVNGSGPSAWATAACATTPLVTRTALDLTSSSYVRVPDAVGLRLTACTIEAWIRRDGAGTGTNTGTGGIPDAIPLVSKGRADTEAAAADINYLLGIRASDGVLCADFEEGPSGASPSLNHPVVGVTPIAAGSGWHHVAATYDGATWSLYLDGNLEATLAVGQPLGSASTVDVGLGSAFTSAGAAGGFFDGAFDEVRVWNVARTLAEIRGTANAELASATPGLVARWALDEGAGTAVGGSAGTSFNGTINGAGYAWIAPAPFNLAFNDPPALPALVSPADDATGVPPNATLRVGTADADGDSLTVRFYGRATAGAVGPDFTLIGLPDTQYYTGELNGGSNAMLKSQINWIIANRVARNIAYAVQLGDCVEHGDNSGNPIEWIRADSAYLAIEDPLLTSLTDGIPYGICVGNHDQSPIGTPDGASTVFYNQYFGISRFAGRAYYGGNYRTNNDNWFDLFSVSGYDFLSIGLEYDTTPDVAVLDWADSLMKAYPGRRALVSSHNFANTGNPATFSTQGQTTYDALKDNPNFFMMLCGHVAGEGRRSDTFEGRTVHTMMSDYQGRSGGGSGLLRILEFSPANNVIRVRTYSPWLGTYETDADSSSQFTLAYDLGPGAAPFQLIGTVRVLAGQEAQVVWSGRAGFTGYDWYATVADDAVTRTGPTWSFTTGEAVPPSVTVTAPNGAGSLAVGSAATLQWNATDNVAVASVDLQLSRTGSGGPFEDIALAVPNTGSHSWTVTGPATSNAFLRVVARDAMGNVGSDLSDAAFSITSTVAVEGASAASFALEAVAPNPVAGLAHVSFAVPRAAPVRIAVVDLAGREVAVLVDGTFRPGVHSVRWDARGRAGALSSGIYFVSMRSPGFTAVRRVALVH